MTEPIFCPFCGKTEKIYVSRYQSEGHWVSTVGCSACNATGPVGNAEAEAISKWNERYVAVEEAAPAKRRGGRRKKGETA